MNRVRAEVEFWDGHARTRDSAEAAVWSEPGWDQHTLDHLRRITKHLAELPSRHVLDLGCGVGRLAIPLAKAQPSLSIVGVDISTGMLALAHETGEQLDNVSFVHGDGRTIPRSDPRDAPLPSFGGAYSVLLFQHLPAEAVSVYLDELAYMLLPRGRFLCQFVESDGVDGPFSFSHSCEWMRAAVGSAGFAWSATQPDESRPGWHWLLAQR